MRSSTRRDQAAATRAHIIDVSLRLFGELGYAATSTRRIADEAGVSEGAIFHHFPTKADILASLPEYRPTLVREIQLLVESEAERPVDEFFDLLTQRFVELVSRERTYVSLLLAESGHHIELDALFRQLLDGTADAVAGYLDRRVAVGELRADLPTAVAARTLLGALLFLLLTNRYADEAELRRRSADYTRDVLDVWFNSAYAR